MILFANAKINIGLSVFNKRDDGYHNIVSTLIPIPVYDIIEIQKSSSPSFTYSGILVSAEKNLVLDAYELVQKNFNISPIRLHLHKTIPVGSGLGGGSSDAVATLKGLNQLYDLQVGPEKLKALALQLGSDCPFFVDNVTSNVQGRGEILEPTNGFPGSFCKLIFTGISISTEEAFNNLERHDDPFAFDLEFQNDFENWAFRKFPELENIKESLYKEGAFIANMTGSGSAIFGIFKKRPEPSNKYPFERIFELK